MLVIGGLFSALYSTAQNAIDALRYSQRNYGGTARSISMGGAFGALGGDFSVLSTNPAGIAIYRRSELTFTPSFFHQQTTSAYEGISLIDDKSSVNFDNGGIILSYYDSDSKNTWKGLTFGFGYNRMNNFNNRIAISGKSYTSSLLDIYLADAANVNGNIKSMDAFGTQLAYKTGAIWLDSASGNFYHHLMPNYGEQQGKSIASGGGMGETVLSLGGNYDDRLYIGATVGIDRIRYDEQSQYQENGDSTALNGFKSFSLTQDLLTTGNGINFKIGVIYKPTDWFRFGGALHTPTYYSMHDQWSSSMTTKFIKPDEAFTSQSPNGTFDYSLVTPMRAIGSLAFVIKQMALIGIDYEFVDYRSARLHAGSNYGFSDENSTINQTYTTANNFRFGIEYRLNPVSIRAGIAYYGSPYKKTLQNNAIRLDYTGGIGFRMNKLFIDLATVISQTSDLYYLYDSPLINPSHDRMMNFKLLATIGFRF